MNRTEVKKTDILIVGCGIAGLTAATTFLKLGYKCICVDQNNVFSPKKDNTDFRSTAYLNNSIKVFKNNGLWKELKKISQPMKKMQIYCLSENKIDSFGFFDSKDVGEETFGFNLCNYETQEKIIQNLKKNKKIEFVFNVSVSGILFRTSENILSLSNGEKIKSKLVIAADGFNSRIREICNIKKISKFFNQKALVFQVSHQKPHQNSSYEFYKKNSSLTLVPLKDKFQSAVVLMDKIENIENLIKEKKPSFEKEINFRTNKIRGELKLASEKKSYLIKSHYIKKLYCSRLAFIGEAAHSMPPIGAQGLNTSFSDISELEILFKNKENLENYNFCKTNLEKYNRRRLPVILSTIKAVNTLNFSTKTNSQTIKLVRNKTLSFLNTNQTLKKIIIKLGSQNFIHFSK